MPKTKSSLSRLNLQPIGPVPTVPDAVKSPAKRSNPEYQQISTYIPKSLYRSVKMKLFGQGRELSDLAEDLLREWDNRV
jgi:hypothetical protein